jgi:hypothetical protein
MENITNNLQNLNLNNHINFIIKIQSLNMQYVINIKLCQKWRFKINL